MSLQFVWYLLFLLGWGSEEIHFCHHLVLFYQKLLLDPQCLSWKNQTLDERINVPENSCFRVLCGELLYQNTFEGFYSQKRKKKVWKRSSLTPFGTKGQSWAESSCLLNTVQCLMLKWGQKYFECGLSLWFLRGFAKTLQKANYDLAGHLLIVDNLVQGYFKSL